MSDNTNTIVVSTIDTDSSQFGGVYLLEESPSGSSWTNTNIGNYDVYRVAFSPNYTNDRQLIAVASDEVDTYIESKIYNGTWGQMIGNAHITDIVPSAANIAFPDNYNYLSANAVYFLGIDSGAGSGDIYKIKSALIPSASIATDLNIGSLYGTNGVDISSLVSSGSTILAGCAGNARVYLSNDNGVSWTQCAKPPTGQTDTCVLLAPDFATQHKAYAVTRGIESAFSYSNDGGLTWNQISLIDTKISDIPDFTTPLTTSTFMLTFNGDNLKQSLWRTTDSGSTWDRILCSSFTGINNLKLVKVIPQYSTGNPIILVAGQKDNIPVIWKSTDNGQNFTLVAAPCAVDTWSIVDSNTWFVGGYDGSKGLVYRTINGGNFFTPQAEAGGQPLTSLVASPNYPQDKTVLAGNTVGQVYLSQDNGSTFNLLGQQLPLTAGVGRISLAFDSKFNDNKTVYAGTDAKVISTGRDRIFRFTIGKSNGWQSVYGSLPDNAIIKQMAVTSDGTLYAVNTEAIVNADEKGGLVRSLDPNASSPTFETILSGLDDTITLNKLSICGNQIWTVDTKDTQLMTFIDSLSAPVTLVSPDNKASGVATTNLDLKWQTLNGSTEYEWQASNSTSFTDIPAGLTGTSESSSARPTGLEPAATYYWHVRTSQPYLSRWSDTWSFNTVLGGSNIVPSLSVPEAGAKTPVKPIFQWSTIVSAEKYDLLVAKDASFNNVVIDKTGDNALASNAWESDINLENSTTYYWKVKARSDRTFGTWSAVSAFTTEPVLPVPASTNQPLSPTAPPAQQVQTASAITVSTVTVSVANNPQPVTINVNIPSWVTYGGIALLAVIVIALTILVVTTIRRRR